MLRAGRGQDGGKRYYVTEKQLRQMVDRRVKEKLQGRLEMEKQKTLKEMTVMMAEVPMYAVLEHFGDIRLKEKDGKSRAEVLAEIILEDCMCVLDDYVSLAEISDTIKSKYKVDVDKFRRKMRRPGWKVRELRHADARTASKNMV